ncbi:hypothetical protein IG631_12349 [Alternaria alternata]|nr:hypothetical protein IG631_12349 [Alternaria alternata]
MAINLVCFMPEWRVLDGDAVKRKGSSKDDPANLVDMSNGKVWRDHRVAAVA